MKILSMPAGQASQLKIYDNGIWNVGYENPGTYKYYGNTPGGYTLQANKLECSVSGQKMIGTLNGIDLTNYTTLHVVAKATAGGGSFGVGLSKDVSGFAVYEVINTIGVTVDYACDVSALTGNYYVFISTGNNSANEIYEIYLA